MSEDENEFTDHERFVLACDEEPGGWEKLLGCYRIPVPKRRPFADTFYVPGPDAVDVERVLRRWAHRWQSAAYPTIATVFALCAEVKRQGQPFVVLDALTAARRETRESTQRRAVSRVRQYLTTIRYGQLLEADERFLEALTNA